MSSSSDNKQIKQAVGKAAADLIENGMVVGLGTGSTAACFIEALSQRCQKGLKIKAVATSHSSEEQARANHIPVIDINHRSSIDIAIDGADEVDPQKRMIKGGGGALFREKIVAGMSRKFIVIIDHTKLVDHLGRFPLAVEISPFGYRSTLDKLKKKGYSGSLRTLPNKEVFISENANYIVDIPLSYPCLTPEHTDEQIQSIPGVIETGFFFNMAERILVGYPDGKIKILD